MCCGLFREGKQVPKQRKGLIWRFSNGTSVFSSSYVKAIAELEKVNSRDFWASEITDGVWDVQLTDSVIVYGIQAKTVTEAVRIARWRTHLDKSIKNVDNQDINVF